MTTKTVKKGEAEFGELDALVLKEIVRNVVQINLESSKLCFNVLSDNFGDMSDSVDLNRLSMREPIEFINDVEKLKEKIIVNATKRQTFLESIRDKAKLTS